MEQGELKVVTTRGACEILKVSRTMFETKIKHRLTKLEKVGVRNFYLYDEVVRLSKDMGVLVTPKYKVIA